MTITKLQHGQQVQIKGKRPYHQDATVGTLKGFYEENPHFGEFNQSVSDRAYNIAQGEKRDQSVHLSVGDQVELEGQLFTIENDHNNNFKFVAVQ
jgi:hypothetical protein